MKIRGNTVGTPIKPEKVIEKGGGAVDLSNYYTKGEIDQLAMELSEAVLYGMASENYVNETIDLRIGNISTALAELRTYAQSLKGGESA